MSGVRRSGESGNPGDEGSGTTTALGFFFFNFDFAPVPKRSNEWLSRMLFKLPPGAVEARWRILGPVLCGLEKSDWIANDINHVRVKSPLSFPVFPKQLCTLSAESKRSRKGRESRREGIILSLPTFDSFCPTPVLRVSTMLGGPIRAGKFGWRQ